MGKLKFIQLSLFFVTCFYSCALASYNLTEPLADMMREQIKLEMQASLFYQTYGHYFENSHQALHGIANYFIDQSLEEKKHADKLMTYLNQRNVAVKTLKEIPEFCSELRVKKLCHLITGKLTTALKIDVPLMAVQNAIDLEEKVYKKLEEIVEGSDAQLSHFIEHEYLDEQIEFIKELKDYETRLTKINESYIGLLLFDRWLQEDKKNKS